ncbi:MAG TPA: hypothetical protein DCE18_12335 [Syntrophobacteraceae bacterium]|nr:hypothetical protein [Syntrophobacteraceae bacterium]HBZ53781.1 hypothetical protein [Syntrophobacteraceae bacterium]
MSKRNPAASHKSKGLFKVRLRLIMMPSSFLLFFRQAVRQLDAPFAVEEMRQFCYISLYIKYFFMEIKRLIRAPAELDGNASCHAA